MVNLNLLALAAAALAPALVSAAPSSIEKRVPALPTNKPCLRLDDTARADVLDGIKYAEVAELNGANKHNVYPYSFYGDARAGVIALYLKAAPSAPYVNVYAFQPMTGDLPVMFWLAKGDECRIRNQDLNTIDTMGATVYKKI
ncbi:hypothetical protein CBS101457_005065 [Exobasidium rhododendri]|nr:hypothetical protein CBS101457_005065 [Exobasidium rhododendri]